jgi:hypothetical protein
MLGGIILQLEMNKMAVVLKKIKIFFLTTPLKFFTGVYGRRCDRARFLTSGTIHKYQCVPNNVWIDTGPLTNPHPQTYIWLRNKASIIDFHKHSN